MFLLKNMSAINFTREECGEVYSRIQHLRPRYLEYLQEQIKDLEDRLGENLYDQLKDIKEEIEHSQDIKETQQDNIDQDLKSSSDLAWHKIFDGKCPDEYPGLFPKFLDEIKEICENVMYTEESIDNQYKREKELRDKERELNRLIKEGSDASIYEKIATLKQMVNNLNIYTLIPDTLTDDFLKFMQKEHPELYEKSQQIYNFLRDHPEINFPLFSCSGCGKRLSVNRLLILDSGAHRAIPNKFTNYLGYTCMK